MRHEPGKAAGGAALELWGGHECTVNRVHDAWFDQTIRAGHEDRPEDVALFAGLGICKLRYPALWERISPRHADERDFTWTDQRLAEIRDRGMEAILTLCHHGSGPHYTSLLDESFAPGLARHAAAVAERYPWVEDYTPVNEPLTTARFSALYGFWYPHQRDEGAFWLALLNETDATRLSMRAIRQVNPNARLVQTDDLGFCHASEPLQPEADFQNQRRWMGWDLLCGKVVPGHALWDRLASFGLVDRLRAIAEDPCPPDVIGINHYLSSERLLDHRIELHGARGLADRAIGETGGVPHVDVDAARSMPGEVIGLAGLLDQAWNRYRLPIAVTECHNGSTREEQARWFIDAWDTVEGLRSQGIDVRALTAWSLLGSYDWNRMVTTNAGHYEPGIFDLRGGKPRPTLMAEVLKALAEGRRPSGPGLDVPGWWREERRAMAAQPGGGFALTLGPRPAPSPKPLAIIGDGDMAEMVARACEARGLHYLLLGHASLGQLGAASPWALFDATEPARRLDMQELAAICRNTGAIGATLRQHHADEDAQPVPPELLLVATAPLFTADEDGFEAQLVDALDAGEHVEVDARQDWNAAYAPTVIDGVLDLLLDRATGRVHFVAEPGWSLADAGRAIAEVAGHDACHVIDQGSRGLDLAGGPSVVSYLPSLETVLERFVHDRRWHRQLARQDGLVLEAAE